MKYLAIFLTFTLTLLFIFYLQSKNAKNTTAISSQTNHSATSCNILTNTDNSKNKIDTNHVQPYIIPDKHTYGLDVIIPDEYNAGVEIITPDEYNAGVEIITPDEYNAGEIITPDEYNAEEIITPY